MKNEMKKVKKVRRNFSIILLFSTALTFLVGISPSSANDGYQVTFERQITNNKFVHARPAVYENTIVYEDNRNGNFDIYSYNLITNKETRITTNPKNQLYPEIYGDKIIYTDNRNDESDIYMYDITLKKEVPIAVAPGFQAEPRIYNNKIVWTDNRNGNSDIYMFDLETQQECQITFNSDNQESPAIYGDVIVWSDSRGDEGSIYMYEISVGEETKLASLSSFRANVDIFGDKIVWDDLCNGQNDAFLYDLAKQTKTQISSRSTSQDRPRIYGDLVVWADIVHAWDAPPNGIIYVYDLISKQEIQITNDSTTADFPAIFEKKIVWSGVRNHNSEIYMMNLSKELTNLSVKLKVGNPYMFINGETVEIDPGRGTKPVILHGKTLIPLRAFIEALGGLVTWDSLEKKVTIIIIDKKIELWVGNKKAKVNGIEKELEVAAQGINGRIMIPLRFVAENLGLEVGWDQKSEQITLNSKN